MFVPPPPERVPDLLADLPKFPNETLDPARCGGDIVVQACANDPQVAVHAIRNLARVGFGTVAVRYSQLGFGRTSSTTREQSTPRNLFGFKDGTNNIKAEDTGTLNDQVWVAKGDGPDWMTGGTYLISRRIRMRIEAWDRTTLLEQERVIGRHKLSDIEIPDDKKAPDSHVALNSITAPDGTDRQIVRENMPFGSVGSGTFGTYFIGYAADVTTIEEMLRHMFLGDPPGNHDRILDFSTAVTGSLFFIPTIDFLDAQGD